jgi:shikimate kinase
MHLFLIGPRGSGKSTVARVVARRLDRPYRSTDEAIQLETGRTISELFAARGEAGYRELEVAAVAAASRGPPAVIDLGGGAILSPVSRAVLAATGRTVWLFADPEILWIRISSDPASASTRPALCCGADGFGDSACGENETSLDPGLAEMRRVVAARQAIYAACADCEIDTGRLTPEEVARRIVAWFEPVDKSTGRPSQPVSRAGSDPAESQPP